MMKSRQAVAAGVVLLGSAAPLFAVNIGGLDIPPGPTFQVGQIYQNNPVAIGNTLAGYGKIDSINSIPVGTLAPGGELTFAFSGYTAASISPTEVRYSGGSIRFYLGFGADNDFTTGNPGGSAGDLVEATNGTLFLTVKGHAVDAAGNTLIGTGVNLGTATPTGFESGLLDVDTSAGGIANAFFDTNTIAALFAGPADFEWGASFSGLNPVYPNEGPGGAAALRGSVDTTGNLVEIPEPATPFMLVALGGLSCLARRRVML